jgi:hypothetical protein
VSSAAMNPYAVHVERAADPHELRWVMHWPALASAPDGRRVPPPRSALGRLVSARSIRSLRVLRGDLVVRADDWTSALTAIVNDAVVADRQVAGAWWFEAASAVSVRRGS